MCTWSTTYYIMSCHLKRSNPWNWLPIYGFGHVKMWGWVMTQHPNMMVRS